MGDFHITVKITFILDSQQHPETKKVNMDFPLPLFHYRIVAHSIPGGRVSQLPRSISHHKSLFEILFNTIEKEKSDFVISSHYMNFDGDMVKANLISTQKDIISFYPVYNSKGFTKTQFLMSVVIPFYTCAN